MTVGDDDRVAIGGSGRCLGSKLFLYLEERLKDFVLVVVIVVHDVDEQGIIH